LKLYYIYIIGNIERSKEQEVTGAGVARQSLSLFQDTAARAVTLSFKVLLYSYVFYEECEDFRRGDYYDEYEE
ncbi:hypothetical protein HW555_000918, partial [Spodoptera exigua]